jgi:hypothetical protein
VRPQVGSNQPSFGEETSIIGVSSRADLRLVDGWTIVTHS